ncbi:class I SAM-dependent methyltransferase [Rhodococcoides corynebacterioides]|uniref:Class I SAM-dependent methyltransferase n=1 Tax=Rhodococcoides corynebacterioides TaxID=53972 RepID=A0ABS7P5T3_9NOCA|nr:class I SAM-dependent methyltransferase [Rhodococcus corynebacterioides]MBY6367222.1 class I SAM-dependent methyltransferase [Rhodococcus corynebacterioides]MBY6407364.1 class I SAM-dependent methyltransferase [Rhodococcus corynebacterioides]
MQRRSRRLDRLCRLCGSSVLESVLDLGATPPCESFLTADGLDEPEPTYPLHVRVCRECLLLQIPALVSPDETFTEYAYFSSFSSSWVEHARRFVAEADRRLTLQDRDDAFVVEVASNDGYLLRHVVDRGIRCLGIEPSVNVGAAARAAGVPTETAFLNPETAARVRAEHGPAALVVANNVYAHIPDVLGFTEGLRTLVADDGLVSIEVHHALKLVAEAQFDTVYHEHFQYWTVLTAMRALEKGDLTVVDVEALPTHGGSIRLWATPSGNAGPPSERTLDLLEAERRAGLHTVAGYRGLESAAREARAAVLEFLLDCRRRGERVVGYGAPGKGNTLLNYCGIRPDLLEYTVDRNPYKHGRFTPGTRIPIHHPDRIAVDRPDVVMVLPWNLEDELTAQLQYVADWGGRVVFPLPSLHTADLSHVTPSTDEPAEALS